MVFGPGRKPVPQVPVELLSEFNTVIQRTKTDNSGRYSFNGVPSGRLAVKVLPLGTNLEEQVQETQVATMNVDGRAEFVQLDFELRERRSRDNRLGSGGAVFFQEIPPEARKMYDAALSDLDAKKNAAGEANLQAAIRIFPTYYDALNRLGLLAIELNKYDVAREVFSKAAAVNDRSFTSWYGLSYANFSLNKISEAIPEAEKALQLDKTSVDVYLLLGIMQRRAKDYTTAEKSLLQAKKLDNGRNPDIPWNLALLYAHNLNNYGAAAAELEAYLKLVPTAPNKSNIEKLIQQFRQKASTKTSSNHLGIGPPNSRVSMTPLL
jgi:tetratricopeptide (TPR) repeat protein